MEVKELQQNLKDKGYSIVVDGSFGPKTKAILEDYQKKSNLKVTGEIDQQTIDSFNKNSTIQSQMQSQILTDCKASFLNKTQYCNSVSKKIGICLHHTASGPNAEDVVRVWNQDDRGRVATHFIIGANGTKLQCIPLDNWGYHIATSRMGFSSEHNDNTSARYIGIEICNWGYLEKKGNKYFNYVGGEVPESQVIKLDKPFRTFEYWHAYTNEQINSLEHLIKDLIAHFGFDTSNDPIAEDERWFDLSWQALAHKRVLTTHSNFEYGKFDTFPQPELIRMLNRL